MTPVTPPITKDGIKATAYSIGVVNLTLPPHMVNNQLKILIPVGTAIAIVATAKIALAIGPRPVVNIWCAQTMNPKNPINIVAKTIDEYPKSLFLANVGKISEKIPNAGSIKIYTSG